MERSKEAVKARDQCAPLHFLEFSNTVLYSTVRSLVESRQLEVSRLGVEKPLGRTPYVNLQHYLPTTVLDDQSLRVTFA